MVLSGTLFIEVPPSIIPMFIVEYGMPKNGLGVFRNFSSKSIIFFRKSTAFLFELFPSIGVLECVVIPLNLNTYSSNPFDPIIGIRSVGSTIKTCGGNFVFASTKSLIPPNMISSSYVQYIAMPFFNSDNLMFATAAITAAIPPFISHAPSPYSFSFFSVKVKGSVSQPSVIPTVSVCPRNPIAGSCPYLAISTSLPVSLFFVRSILNPSLRK